MAYFLLTGATGLLGRYLLRDLTLADVPLAVVVRRTRFESAVQRIETAMARWENELGRGLPRPVVLEGDISQPGLGLNQEDLHWVANNCQAVIHSAASLTFYAEDEAGEPYRSNLLGTRNVIELCRKARIRQLHHVSTAYVCGQRRGQILESELDIGQLPGNDYEKTKLAAEKEVLASDAFDVVTVYRPSIIVGDSRTGYTTSYHGFYTPLRLVHALVQAISWQSLLTGDFLGRLELEGHERKNLVPVDWVSAAMTELITHPEHHGQTYHLTNPAPSTAGEMQAAIVEALAQTVLTNSGRDLLDTSGDDFVASFHEQMKVYQSYWSDDPEFDSSQTRAALPHLPCPQVDRQVMERLIRFAIDTNFGWPREASIVPPFNVAGLLERWLQAGQQRTDDAGQFRYVDLQVVGRGGGQWHLAIERGMLIGVGKGLRYDSGLSCFLTSATLAELAQGTLSLTEAINSGRLVVTGNSVHTTELDGLFRELLSDEHPRFTSFAFIE